MSKPGQSFVELLKLYQLIQNECFDFDLYKIIALSETIEIDYKLKTLSTFSENDVNDFYNLLENYYTKMKVKILNITNIFEEQIKIITDKTI